MEQKRPKTWIWPALFVVGIGASLLLSGLAGSYLPNGAPAITSNDQYEATLKQANEIFKAEISRPEGKPLSDADRAQINKALKLYDSLSQFYPAKMGPYFASGRLELLLGDSEVAARNFKQALDNRNQATPDSPEAVKQLTADAYYSLAMAYVNMNDFKDAAQPIDEAIELYKNRGDYRYLRARVEIQDKKISEAKSDLLEAMRLEPLDEKAASLYKFVQSASPNLKAASP